MHGSARILEEYLHTYKKINIGLAYVGEHAIRNILPSLITSPYFNIKGLYFRTLNKKIKKKFKNYKIYNNYDELLNDKKIHCVYISSPNNSHFKFSYKALKKKKHVICEKPLVTKFTDVLKLIKLSLLVKKFIFEAFMFQYHHQFYELKNLLKKKTTGKILTIIGRFGYPHLNKKNIRYKKNLDGGSFFDCACYLSKAIHLILGDNVQNIYGKISKKTKYEVDIDGSCFIKYKTDKSVFLDWGIGRSYVNELDIWTENYLIKAERFFSKSKKINTSINLLNSKGVKTVIKIKKMNHFEKMFENFFYIIKKKKLLNHLEYLREYQRFFFLIKKNLNNKYEK